MMGACASADWTTHKSAAATHAMWRIICVSRWLGNTIPLESDCRARAALAARGPCRRGDCIACGPPRQPHDLGEMILEIVPQPISECVRPARDAPPDLLGPEERYVGDFRRVGPRNVRQRAEIHVDQLVFRKPAVEPG